MNIYNVVFSEYREALLYSKIHDFERDTYIHTFIYVQGERERERGKGDEAV